jgi:hypothetical protein
MKIDDLVTTARDAITVRRVYGEPVTENGVTVIPAASVWGGGGGGGRDQQGQEGQGGGFGLQLAPSAPTSSKTAMCAGRPRSTSTGLSACWERSRSPGR